MDKKVSPRGKKQKIIDKMVKKPGLRARVDAHCCSCAYDELDTGTWRKQVENCAIVDCALHSIRPSSKTNRIIKETQL